jgi:DNA-binding NarL/FixJ family response regulator
MSAEERPIRVLLAEDDPMMREVVRDLLVESGFEIAGEADNGVDAVELTASSDPDVAIFDLRMPAMGGLEAAREVRRTHPLTQVVILTAYDDPALKSEALTAGVYAFLVKGCPADLVIGVVRKAGERRLEIESASV